MLLNSKNPQLLKQTLTAVIATKQTTDDMCTSHSTSSSISESWPETTRMPQSTSRGTSCTSRTSARYYDDDDYYYYHYYYYHCHCNFHCYCYSYC